MKAFLFLVVAVALAMADDTEKVVEKKDVVVGTLPWGLPAVRIGYDDGLYYPGKYDNKATVIPAITSYTAGIHPYAYGAWPNLYGWNYPFVY